MENEEKLQSLDDVLNKYKNIKYAGTGFSIHLLTVLFIILKLTGAITWSWWLVCLPSLLAFGLGVLIVLFAVLLFIVLYAHFKS